MPKTKQTPPTQFRLAPEDHIRFDLRCRLEGKQRTELARKAILFYLDHHDSKEIATFESPIAERLKKMEDRLAAVLAKSSFENNKRMDTLTNRLTKLNARIAMDAGLTYMIMFKMMNHATREETVAWAAANAWTRLQTKLTDPDTNIQQLMHCLDGEPNNAPNGSKA